MIVFDVNPLVYAFRPDSSEHDAYRAMLLRTMAGREPYGVPDVVLSAVVRICTNRRVYRQPSPMAEALSFVEAVRNGPACLLLPSTPEQWRLFLALCAVPGVSGNHVPDAFIAAFALAHDADLVTSDAAMSRFPGIRVRHPLADD